MRKPLLIITGLLVLLGIAVVVRPIDAAPPPPLPVPPQEQQPEEALFSDPIPPAEDVTTAVFNPAASACRARRGKCYVASSRQRVGEWFLYQGQTCAVSYQQDIVWQLKCTWKRPGLDFVQVRTRARRYLPLDSRRQKTLTATAETVVEQYFSQTFAQLLAQTCEIRSAISALARTARHIHGDAYAGKRSGLGTRFQIGSDVAPRCSGLTRVGFFSSRCAKRYPGRRGNLKLHSFLRAT